MGEGVDLLDQGHVDQAIKVLFEAAAIDPVYFGTWYNLGLAYKRSRAWQDALDSFLRAWTRFPTGSPTEVYASILWNVGIAASALSAWRYAWRAWLALGFPILKMSDDPPVLPMGLAFVCEDPNDPVLGRRIDPARVELLAHAARDHRFVPGVVVIHDAERVGTQQHQGKDLPVFPVLQLVTGLGPAFDPTEDAALPALHRLPS